MAEERTPDTGSGGVGVDAGAAAGAEKAGDGREPPRGLLAESTGWLLSGVAREVTVELEQALRRDDLRWREYGVLGTLEAAGALSQQEIGRRLGVDRSTMVHLIDVLEDRGLVARSRDRTDRRAYSIELTEAGRALLAEVLHPVTAEVHERVIGRLTSEDHATLNRILATLAGGG